MHKSLFTQTDHATPLLTSTLWFYSAMLEMGISKSWPHALEQMTGSKEMSVAPIMEYFKPLREWLEKERCSTKYKIGWPGQPADGVEDCPTSKPSSANGIKSCSLAILFCAIVIEAFAYI
jgi:hypothetical protein